MRAVDLPVATDLQAELSSPSAVRKALLARGWDLNWVDGVTGEVQKGRLRATVPQIEAAVRVSMCGRRHAARRGGTCSPLWQSRWPVRALLYLPINSVLCPVQISYLESLGIPLKSVENMVSMNKLVRPLLFGLLSAACRQLLFALRCRRQRWGRHRR